MPLPETLGRLRRVRRLGSGAFATVWLYHDDVLAADVAVRTPTDERADLGEAFLQQARTLRAVRSEHVVEVYDLGRTADGTPYLVLGHADLGTVADLVAGGPLAPAEAVDLVDQAARGLADLHAAGLVHRDVRPRTLLLRSDPDRGRRLLVADPGPAEPGALDQAGERAPELARGGPVDGRVDVYGLGTVADRLFGGAAEGPVADVIARATHPDPDRRWPDPPAFAEALRAAVPEPERPNSAAPPVRRRWHWVAAAAAVLVAALLGLGLAAGTPGPPSSGQPVASAPAAYCTGLVEQGEALSGLSASDPKDLRRGTAAVHTIRRLAPPEVAADWASLDDPLLAFEAALTATGTSWEEYAADPDRAHPRVVEAAAAMRRDLAGAAETLGRIQQHARQACR